MKGSTDEAASRAWMYGLAGAVLALDRLTKWIIESRVSQFDSRVVIPGFFEIVHSQNRGAAFGLFSESSAEWRTLLLIGFSVAALVALVVMLWRSPRLDRKTAVALALILGGAAGNVFDRVFRAGEVTDFLLFYIGRYQWPAFNAADSAIVIGSGLLLLDLLVKRQPASTQNVS